MLIDPVGSAASARRRRSLQVSCFTLRGNAERPVTVTEGTNRLLGLRSERILEIPAA